MQSPEKHKIDSEYWAIINYNAKKNNLYEDILVPIAADDEAVKSVIKHLIEKSAEPADIQVIYDEMEGLLAERYGLPPALSSRVFKKCEFAAREQLYGEA